MSGWGHFIAPLRNWPVHTIGCRTEKLSRCQLCFLNHGIKTRLRLEETLHWHCPVSLSWWIWTSCEAARELGHSFFLLLLPSQLISSFRYCIWFHSSDQGLKYWTEGFLSDVVHVQIQCWESWVKFIVLHLADLAIIISCSWLFKVLWSEGAMSVIYYSNSELYIVILLLLLLAVLSTL